MSEETEAGGGALDTGISFSYQNSFSLHSPYLWERAELHPPFLQSNPSSALSGTYKQSGPRGNTPWAGNPPGMSNMGPLFITRVSCPSFSFSVYFFLLHLYCLSDTSSFIPIFSSSCIGVKPSGSPRVAPP